MRSRDLFLLFVLLALSVACGSDPSGTPSMDVTSADDVEYMGKPCSSNKDCGDGFCDPIEGACVMCTVDSHCPDGLRCVSGACLEGILCQPGAASCDEEGNSVVCNEVGSGFTLSESCDDGIECTKDGCIEGAGCTHAPDDAFCDDGSDCTEDWCDLEKDCRHKVSDECQAGGLADVTPSKVIFPDTIPEEQVTKEKLEISNAGLGTLKLLRITASPEEGPFYFQHGNEALLSDLLFEEPLVVAAGESLELTLLFAPQVLGEFKGTLSIHTNDPTKPEGVVTISLVGSGVADNCVGVSTETVAFGEVKVGVTKELDVTLENCGEGLVPVYTVDLVDNSAGVFSLVAALSPPFDLDVQQKTVITLGFAPAKAGTSYAAKLRIENGAPQTPVLEVALSGSGVQTP